MGLAGKLSVAALVLAVGVAWFINPLQRLRLAKERQPAVLPQQQLPASILNLTLLSTNDVHSAVTGIGASDQLAVGGYARLASALKKLRADPSWEYLTLDAGDWYAGSLFDKLGPHSNASHVPELEYFAAAGYDAVNIGNHDFDSGDTGLAHMLAKAAQRGVQLDVLSANIRARSGPMTDFIGNPALNVSVKPYIIKSFPVPSSSASTSSPSAVRVAIVGLLGPDGSLCSNGIRGPVEFIGFDDVESRKEQGKLEQFVRDMMPVLREEEAVDFVVVLLHGGPDEARSLARNVPGIDVISSGHTHESYYLGVASETYGSHAPQTTHVVQCGHSGNSISDIRFVVDSQRRLHLARKPTCMSVDHQVEEDVHVRQMVHTWKSELTRVMNHSFGYDQVIYHGRDGSVFDSSSDYVRHALTVSNLLLNQVNRHLRDMGMEEADIYLSCPTCIRSRPHLEDGNVVMRFSDVYRMLSISTTSDIVVFYLSRENAYRLLNFVPVLGKILSYKFMITVAGVEYDLNPWGLPFFGLLENLRMVRRDGSELPYAEWPPYIRVASSTYIARHIWKTNKYTFGVLPYIACDAQGKQVPLADVVVPNLPREYSLLAEYLVSTQLSAMQDLSHGTVY